MMTKEDILSRRAVRMQNIIVSKIDTRSELNNSFTLLLSPLESWEMLKKISYEMYYLQTGIKADLNIDKKSVHIFQRDLQCI